MILNGNGRFLLFSGDGLVPIGSPHDAHDWTEDWILHNMLKRSFLIVSYPLKRYANCTSLESGLAWNSRGHITYKGLSHKLWLRRGGGVLHSLLTGTLCTVPTSGKGLRMIIVDAIAKHGPWVSRLVSAPAPANQLSSIGV